MRATTSSVAGRVPFGFVISALGVLDVSHTDRFRALFDFLVLDCAYEEF